MITHPISTYAPPIPESDVSGLPADLAGKQPLDSDLTAIAALATTSFGRSLLALADAAAGRSAMGLVVGTDVQAHDADLDALAALTTTSFGRALLTQADAAAVRSYAGLVIGTDVQAHDADLDSIAALATTTFGRSLLTQADAKSARGTLASKGRAGRLRYGPTAQGNLSSVNTTANRVYYVRVPIDESGSLTGIEVVIGATGSVGNARGGIHDSSGARLAFSGAVAVPGANARLQLPFTASQAVDPAFYILSVQFTGVASLWMAYCNELSSTNDPGSAGIPASLTPPTAAGGGLIPAPMINTY